MGNLLQGILFTQCSALNAHACAHGMMLHHAVGNTSVKSDGSTVRI
jgi:hypothetical protein